MGERSKLMKDFWRGGELFVWMTASGVALSLLMVAGMLGLIMINGLGQFWPGALQETTLKTQETMIGQVVGEEVIPNSVTPDSPAGQRRLSGCVRVRISLDQCRGHCVERAPR